MPTWNHPPNWPPPPIGWYPPSGWQPPRDWPPAPYGWQFWSPDAYTFGPSQVRRRSSTAHTFAGLGAVAVAASPFFTWVHVALFGPLSLFNLVSLNSSRNVVWFPLALIIMGLLSAIFGFVRFTGSMIIVLFVGVICGGFGLLVVAGMIDEIQKQSGIVTIGVGPFVALGGLLTMTIAAIVGLSIEGI